jgi:uncharacterized repeat protein (TIGR01451 family)
MTETASPDPVHTGDQITYSITVTNNHSGTVAGVSLTDSIVSGTLVSATTDQGSCSGTTTITCDIGLLPSGNSAHVTLVVQLPPAFPDFGVDNRSTVVAGDLLPISASVSTRVLQLPDLTATWGSVVHKCKNKHKRGVICSVAGRINIVNQGTATAGACIVRLYLSDDSSYSANDVLLQQANIPSLGAGAQQVMKVQFSLPAGTSASGKFLIAVIDADNVVTESNETNNVIATARFP